jgi:hypothetical protein
MRYHPVDAKDKDSKRNPCAQCGEPLIAAVWSEHITERRVRHVWQCDACGYEFETLVYLRPMTIHQLDAA